MLKDALTRMRACTCQTVINGLLLSPCSNHICCQGGFQHEPETIWSIWPMTQWPVTLKHTHVRFWPHYAGGPPRFVPGHPSDTHTHTHKPPWKHTHMSVRRFVSSASPQRSAGPTCRQLASPHSVWQRETLASVRTELADDKHRNVTKNVLTRFLVFNFSPSRESSHPSCLFGALWRRF